MFCRFGVTIVQNDHDARTISEMRFVFEVSDLAVVNRISRT